MSFFTRTVVGLALLAGVVHVFRKDLQKVARVLQRPAENFVRDVRSELAARPPGAEAPPPLAPPEGAISEALAKAQAPTPAPPAEPPAAGPPREERSEQHLR